MNTTIGIVMKPFLLSQIKETLWKELYVKQDFVDILSKYNATSIGIIPPGISLDRVNSDDIDLSKEKELTDVERNHLISQINLCDGLILQGGLSSHKYEVFIAQYAIEHNIPILGICAGFNNIARAVDATVEYDKELAERHNVYSHERLHHIIVQKNAKVLLQEELPDAVISVNSIHSIIMPECTVHANDKINIEALAKDCGDWGIPKVTVEAFSVSDTRFCLAVKWHPELLPKDRITTIIFSKFIEACEKHNQ